MSSAKAKYPAMSAEEKKRKIEDETMRAVMQKRNSIAEAVIIASVSGREITEADTSTLVEKALAIADQVVAKTLAVKVTVESVINE